MWGKYKVCGAGLCFPCVNLVCNHTSIWWQAGFVDASFPEGTPLTQQQSAVVYSRLGAIKCNVFSRVCLAKNCTLYPSRSASQKSIFFTSTVTGAGDEVGWDFVSRVQSSRISFTGFCNEMERFYTTNNIQAAPFMSPNTFITWFFGWLSQLKVDFRQDIDPWCKYNPKFLACDGTHIGVSVRYQQMQNHCTKPDLPGVNVQPIHKR